MACLNFTLYLNTSFPRSIWTNDVRKLSQLCRQFVGGEYSIDIVQLADERQRAFRDGVLTTPTVLVERADGRKRILGNLAETETFLRSLQAPVASRRAEPFSLLSLLPTWKAGV